MESRRGRLQHQPVPLEIWSADSALMVKLDAALWLRLADRAEVDVLAKAGWGGRGGGAVPVRFFEPLSDELAVVVRYADKAGTEICYRFDADAAIAWIRNHRPQLRLPGADPESTYKAVRCSSRRRASQAGGRIPPNTGRSLA
jgi:hypothetical protein